jgi:uncharacterized membrane protein YoaK (UPF0700 family)
LIAPQGSDAAPAASVLAAARPVAVPAVPRLGGNWIHAAILCAASGMADAVGFVQSGVFAANMTGNTVLAGLSLAAGNWTTAIERGLTLATFFGGAIAGRVLLRAARGRSWLPLTIEAAMLAGAACIDAHLPQAIWLVAAAMGVQSTGMTRFGNVSLSTVVVTGTLSRLGEAVADAVVPRRQPANTGAAIAAPRLLAVTWACYGAGALLAAVLLKITSLSLLVAAAMVLLVALWPVRSRPAR